MENGVKVLIWVCPKCEKQITSLYPNQLESNKQIHLLSCKSD